MEFASFDLVASLQALPESDPIEVDGIQFGSRETCEWECIGFVTVQIRTMCFQHTCA